MLLIFTLVADNSFANTVFQYFNCTRLDDDTIVVTSLPALSCTSSQYKALAGLFYFIIIVCLVAGPLVMVAFLVRARQKGLLTDSKFKYRYGILFEQYKDICFAWEFTVLCR